MKNLKKVLALVLALAMSLSVVAFAGTTFADVADDANYAEAAKVLKSLNIMVGDEQGNFNPDKTVTRAEMAKILCAITGNPTVAPAYCGFNDVPADHWASGYISVARNSGWIDGYGDGNFGPNDIVLYEQAIKLVMSALNYGIFAEKNGGYPYGWLMAAAEANVTRAGATGAVGEQCSRAKIAMIVYYAIEANLMKQEYFSQGDDTWRIQEYDTLLSKYLKTYKLEGKIVDSYKHNGLKKEGLVDFDATKIFDKTIPATSWVTGDYVDQMGITRAAVLDFNNIETKIEEACDLFGHTAIAYISLNEDGDYTIEAISAKSTKNKSIEITDLNNVFSYTLDMGETATKRPDLLDSAAYQFSFWANDRDTDATLSVVRLDPTTYYTVNKGALADISTIAHGVSFSSPATAAEILTANQNRLAGLLPTYGTLKLIDTDNNGYYDLIEVNDFAVAVVQNVNVAKEKITFSASAGIGGSVSFDKEINTSLRDVKITLDGKEIGLADLQENDVLTISTNGSTYYDIVVTRKTVEGKVNAVNSTKQVVYIDGEEYKAANFGGLTAYNEIDEVGAEGIFYLDAQGKVAKFEDTSVASADYAIVDTIATDSMGERSIRMLTYAGTKMTAPLAEEVKINGVRVDLDDALTNAELAKMGFLTVTTGAPYWTDTSVTPNVNYADTFGVGAAGFTDYYDMLTKILTLVPYDHDSNAGTPDQAFNLLGFGATRIELNKIITFGVKGDEVNAINFAVNGTTEKKFGYIGTSTGADSEWQADVNRFKGSNSKIIASNAAVIKMNLNAGEGFNKWSFIKASDLVNEGMYETFYFANQKFNEVGLVVLTHIPSVIKEDAPLAIFAGSRSGVYGESEEDVEFVSYITNGALAETALPVDPTAAAGLSFGDAFLYLTNDEGIVTNVYEVFSAGVINKTTNTVTTMPSTSIPGALSEFKAYGTVGVQENEIYFGSLLKAADGKLAVVTAQNESSTATISGASVEYIPVPATAKLVQYKAFAGESKMFTVLDSVAELEVTESLRNASGNYDVAEAGDHAYVFVRLHKGVVTEVIGVDLIKNN